MTRNDLFDILDIEGVMIAVPIRQQDGATVILSLNDTHENRWTAQYIKRHEAYGAVLKRIDTTTT